MKTAQQIIGLPVVSIIDGNEIGKVKNVIVNSSKGTIDFFVIDSGIRSLSGGVIPVDRVLGIGEYALTILQPDDISDIVKIPAAIELMQKNITVRGTRVLTKKGSLLGETGDMYVDEQNSYNIIGVEFVPADSSIKSGIIPRSSIITFGKDLLVVQDDFVEKLIESLNEAQEEVEDEKKNTSIELEAEAVVPVEEPVELTESDDDLLIKNDFILDIPETIEEKGSVAVDAAEDTEEIAETEAIKAIEDVESLEIASKIQELEDAEDLKIIDEADTSNLEILPDNQDQDMPVEESSLSAAELFEQRQRQYLIGKKVTKAIYDESGKIIINIGEMITDEVVDKVKASGKLIELVMNYEV